MSLNPTLDLLLALLGLVFIGVAALALGLLRSSRQGERGAGSDTTAAAPTLATVSVSGMETGEPQRFNFHPVNAPLSADGAASGGAVLKVHIELDALLFERVAEFLEQASMSEGDNEGNADATQSEGCVITLTDAMPPALGAELGASYLSAAAAALSLARAFAESPDEEDTGEGSSRSFRTLLIDTGSPAWSIYGVPAGEPEGKDEDDGTLPLHSAPDVVPLPEDVPGIYDVAAGRTTLDECLLADDETPRLMALAPGEMPLNWPELLRSAGMRRLLAAARAMADITLLYAPRIAEYPEQTRRLAEWSDGIILIGADLARGTTREERDRRRDAAEFEQAGYRRLSGDVNTPAPAPLLGRIALDFASAPYGPMPEIVHDSAYE